MDDVRGVRRMAQQLIRDLCSGKVHPRVGVGIAPLLNLLPRANQVKDDRAEVRFAEIIRKARERAGLPHTDDTDDDSDSALESEGKP